MSIPKYERLEEDLPPPYSESPPCKEPDELKPPAVPASPAGNKPYSPGPPQYQPYAGPPGAGPRQDPALPQPQTVIIRTIEPCDEPDYMAYSFFTALCCCLVLGIFAFIFSKKTQKANLAGDVIAARKNSRIALILSHISLGVGIVPSQAGFSKAQRKSESESLRWHKVKDAACPIYNEEQQRRHTSKDKQDKGLGKDRLQREQEGVSSEPES
ncbi:Synapse differentiation-inducing gene protein 1-like [Varanus komodoensis]|nr:Synapse differentiation-inducing gene protein 1-like [Varanus komodoensis]